MRTLAALIMICAAATAGCGTESKPYETAPISGRITLDGAPLAGASVTFYPIHNPAAGSLSGPEAVGKTDADGRYTLATVFKDAGATVGPNQVVVSTLQIAANPDDPGLEGKVISPERVPGKYATTEGMLKFEVPRTGSQSADFALSSK